MMEKKELEIEQVYNYIKKNPDVHIADIQRETMLSKIVVTNAIFFLLGAKKIELHRVIGRSELYKVTKEIAIKKEKDLREFKSYCDKKMELLK